MAGFFDQRPWTLASLSLAGGSLVLGTAALLVFLKAGQPSDVAMLAILLSATVSVLLVVAGTVAGFVGLARHEGARSLIGVAACVAAGLPVIVFAALLAFGLSLLGSAG